MKVRTWLILGGLIVGVTAAVAAMALRSGVPVEAASARIDRAWECIDEQAKTRLPETYWITMPYSGRVEPIALSEGALVRRGDPVAQIVPADLRLAVAEARAALREAEASIAQNADDTLERLVLRQAEQYAASMRSAVEAAEAQERSGWAALKYAQRDLARIERLYRKKMETEDNLQLATLRRAQRDVEYRQAVLVHAAMRPLQVATDLLPKTVRRYIARKQLDADVLKQRKAQAAVRLNRARLDRKRGTMTSPVDGVVLRRAVSNERYLAAGATLLEIGQLDNLEVEADVLSVDVVRAQKGDKVEIYGPAIGRRRADDKDHADGEVAKVYPAGFTKISSLGVEQQRVKVIVRFDADDLTWLRAERNLGVGYRVRVRIYTAEKPKALVIPRSALFRGQGGNWQVYAIRDRRARIQDVQVGLINDELVEITSGLSEGEPVVLAPESELTDGARVKVEAKEGQ